MKKGLLVLSAFLCMALTSCKGVGEIGPSESSDLTESMLESLESKTEASLSEESESLVDNESSESALESEKYKDIVVSSVKTEETSVNEVSGKIVDGMGYVINPGTKLFNGYNDKVPSFEIPNFVNFSKTLKIEEDAIYVASDGLSSNNGTAESPVDFETAFGMLSNEAGLVHTLYLAPGIYKFSSTLRLENSGSVDKYKSIIANGEGVIFNFEDQEFGDSSRGVSIQSNYWYIKGITVEYAGDNGMLCGGSYNRIEDCTFRYNQDSGFQLSRYSGTQTNNTMWPGYNYIYNCTSYGNYDSLRETYKGEDADGFAAKLTCGLGNVFNGCITYKNSDDGFDLYCKNTTDDPLLNIGTIIIMNSFSYQNGYAFFTADERNSITEAGDGNGFKMGSKEVSIPHCIINSVAADNMAKGFDDNNSAGPYYLEACSAYNNGRLNGGANFSYRAQSTSYSYFKDCMSFTTKSKTTKDCYMGMAENCYFGSSTGAFTSWYFYDALQSVDSNKGTSNIVAISDSANGPYKATSIGLTAYDPNVSLDKELRNANGTINLKDYLQVAGYSAGAKLHS